MHYFLIAIVGPINLKRGEIMATRWVFLKGSVTEASGQFDGVTKRRKSKWIKFWFVSPEFKWL